MEGLRAGCKGRLVVADGGLHALHLPVAALFGLGCRGVLVIFVDHVVFLVGPHGPDGKGKVENVNGAVQMLDCACS